MAPTWLQHDSIASRNFIIHEADSQMAIIYYLLSISKNSDCPRRMH